MMAACGNIRWMKPMWPKLASILSAKRGLPKVRGAGARRDERGVIDRLRTLDVRGRRFGVIADRRALQRVAARVMLEGGGKLTLVLECFAERELEMNAVRTLRRTARELVPHRGQIGAAEAEGLEVGEAGIRPAGCGAHGEGPPVHLDRP